MMRPATLPRTLRGVGGIRLIDMPGVKYPENVLHGRKGADSLSGKPYTKPPEWGISSHEAAEMLGVSVRSARALLNRKNTPHRLVERPGKCACMYWDKRVVYRMLAKRMPLVQKIPEKMCSAREACYILAIVRSTLSRYVKQGFLKEYQFRHITPTGVRILSYFLRAEVRKLVARRNAARARAESIKREYLQSLWEEQLREKQT